jgi:hypothetical protein
MKKAIFAILILLILGIAVGLYLVYANLDNIVKAAIEKFGSEAVQTSVQVEDVSIQLTEGSAAIRGVTIANPKGFSAPYAFSLGEIATDINLDKTRQQSIVIDLINIQNPEVVYEINAGRQGNLNMLKKNLGTGSAAATNGTKQPSATESGQQINMTISRFVFQDAKLHAKIMPLKDKTYDLELPTLELNELSGTPESISKQVIQQLIDHAQKEIRKRGLDKELEELKAKAKDRLEAEKAKLEDKADSALKKEEEKMQDKLQNLLGR